ncbi:hypothetical protein BJX68DRAFT_230897 [Aspergillus pseudodeflectus]|uniref:Uncharacterized protein n=1 Tax=Aspergillus pseudodeflectus TaxID=176178 RepID=A0ABR4KTK7_9EURO
MIMLISDQKVNSWYKHDAVKGLLKLPSYNLDRDRCVLMFYSERFRQVPDRSNAIVSTVLAGC